MGIETAIIVAGVAAAGATAYAASQNKPKALTSEIDKLSQQKDLSTRKRKALYETQGGVLGQEVEQVGNTSNRGNIFGN